MAESSNELLRLLRQLSNQRRLTPAVLAQRTGMSRGQVRRLLSGREPMLVDDLLKLSTAMELTPTDLGLGGIEGASSEGAETEAITEVGSPLEVLSSAEEESGYYSVHAAELVQTGFRLGCNFLLVCDTSLLQNSGVPDVVLTQHEGRPLTIQFDAAYHGYNKPRFDMDGLKVTLSFDALYECTFVWAAIQRVVFFPEMEPVPEEHPPEPPSEPDGSAKVIRLFN